MTPVIHKPAISALLNRRLCADVGQPGGKCRTTTSRVDNDIRQYILATIGAHPDDVRDTGRGRIARQEAHHTDTPPHFEIVGRSSDPCDRGFRDWPTRRDCIVALVSLAESASDRRRGVPKRIHHQRTGIDERSDHVRGVGVHHLPIAGLEEVQQAKLIHASSFPPVPGCFRIGGKRWVPFHDRDLMAITSQEQRSTQPDDPSTNDNDPSHASMF